MKKVVHTHKTADGRVHRSTEEKKVYTHSAREDFPIYDWRDKSPPVSNLQVLKILTLARLRNNLMISFSGYA